MIGVVDQIARRCVGTDPKAKYEGAGFARVVGWERSRVLGRRLAVVVQRAMEVMGVGDVARRVLGMERGGTGGSK